MKDRYWRTADSFEGTVDHVVEIALPLRQAADGSRYVGYSSVPDRGAFQIGISSEAGVWSPYLVYDMVYTTNEYPNLSSVALRVGEHRWDSTLQITLQDPNWEGRESGFAWLDMDAVIRLAIDPEPPMMRFYTERALPLTYAFRGGDRDAIHYMLRTAIREDFGAKLTIQDIDAMLTGYLEDFPTHSKSQ